MYVVILLCDWTFKPCEKEEEEQEKEEKWNNKLNKFASILLQSQHWCCPLPAALWHRRQIWIKKWCYGRDRLMNRRTFDRCIDAYCVLCSQHRQRTVMKEWWWLSSQSERLWFVAGLLAGCATEWPAQSTGRLQHGRNAVHGISNLHYIIIINCRHSSGHWHQRAVVKGTKSLSLASQLIAYVVAELSAVCSL